MVDDMGGKEEKTNRNGRRSASHGAYATGRQITSFFTVIREKCRNFYLLYQLLDVKLKENNKKIGLAIPDLSSFLERSNTLSRIS